MPHPPIVDDDMVVRLVCARPSDVVFVRGVLEASLGVAVLFAEQGGELTIAGPKSRTLELDELLTDLAAELVNFTVTS